MKLTGRAVVIRQDDVDTDVSAMNVPTGSILVSRVTTPALTPILMCCGGIVTARGDRLSHAAIVGLELDLPTVVGVAGALENISDGQWLTVDAARGIVTVVSQD